MTKCSRRSVANMASQGGGSRRGKSGGGSIVLQVVLAKLALLIANSLKEFQFINSQIHVWKKKGIKNGSSL